MNNENIIHKNIRITGRVQGVGFRYAAKKVANDLSINGFARNLADGDVYIEAEGNENNIIEFINWCNQGPVRSIVKSVDHYAGNLRGYKNFEIK